MSTNEPSSRRGHTYILNPESVAEMGRLLLQDRLTTEAIGGYVLEYIDPVTVYSVLDIGCGPGGWVMGMARTFPHMRVMGVDISTLMVAYARTQVNQEKLNNAYFEVMDALEPLAFPDDHFDLVNIRLGFSWIHREDWPTLLKECFRVTRPGGTMRLTEADTLGMSTSPAFESYRRLFTHLFHDLNYGFSPDGDTFGMTPILGKLLTDAGYQRVQYQPYLADFSYGTRLYAGSIQNLLTIFKGSESLLERLGLATSEELKRLYAVLQDEVCAESFRAVLYWVSASAEK